MQIKKLEIKNFKGITKLKFFPKKLNVIVGRNNTGKTSILEAINILLDPYKLKFHYINYEYEYIQNIIHASEEFSEITAIVDNKEEKLRISHIKNIEMVEVVNDFKKNLVDVLVDDFIVALEEEKENIKNIKKKIGEEVKNRIDEIVNFNHIIRIVEENKKNIIKIVKNVNKKELLYDPSIFENKPVFKIEELKKLNEEIESKCNLIFEGEFYLKRKKTEPRRIIEHITARIEWNKYHKSVYPIYKSAFHAVMMKCGSSSLELQVKSEIGEYANDLSDLMKKVSNKEKKEKLRKIEEIIKEHKLLENLDRLDFDYVSFKDPNKKEPTYIPFSFLGDGSKVMIYILWNLVSLKTDIKYKIVLLDEPETNMHPGYILELLKMLIKFSDELNIQFFITTHSGDFIDLLLNKEGFSNKEQEYLEKELLILRIGKFNEVSVSRTYNYKEAEYVRNELLLDLRGI